MKVDDIVAVLDQLDKALADDHVTGCPEGHAAPATFKGRQADRL
ncbi:hypothetical protein [Streptomyces sp. ISL-98]|nr:hypothetical protein [Streptomyces sp. ISL-98]